MEEESLKHTHTILLSGITQNAVKYIALSGGNPIFSLTEVPESCVYLRFFVARLNPVERMNFFSMMMTGENVTKELLPSQKSRPLLLQTQKEKMPEQQLHKTLQRIHGDKRRQGGLRHGRPKARGRGQLFEALTLLQPYIQSMERLDGQVHFSFRPSFETTSYRFVTRGGGRRTVEDHYLTRFSYHDEPHAPTVDLGGPRSLELVIGPHRGGGIELVNGLMRG